MSRFVLAVALVIAACSKGGAPESHAGSGATTAATKDPAAARAAITSGAAVIDVRTSEEYAGGHLPTATNLPVQDLASRMSEIDALVGGDRAKPVVVYCASGKRAAKAKQQLEAAGYERVINGGGYDDLR